MTIYIGGEANIINGYLWDIGEKIS